jgi:hypothetical protein
VAEGVSVTLEMTQSVLGIPYFLDGERNQSALEASHPDRAALGERLLVHNGVVRAITEEYQREDWLAKVRQQAPPEQPKEFTESRRAYLLRRRPLAVRQLACQLMRIINSERLDDEGQPLTDDIAANTPYVPSSEVLYGYEAAPMSVAMHLRRAGFHRVFDTRVARLSEFTYPADAVDFLRAHPPATVSRLGEHGLIYIKHALHTTTGWLTNLVYEHDLFPVLRLTSKGIEYEAYKTEQQQVLSAAVAQVPYVAKNETPIHVIITELSQGGPRHETFLRKALEDSGLPTPLRRYGGFGNGAPVHVLSQTDARRFREHVQYLTTPQPGEMDAAELCAAADTSPSSLSRSILPHDKLRRRSIFSFDTEGWRTIYPPEVSQAIIRRARVHRLSPHLVTETWILQRFASLSVTTIDKRLVALPNDPIYIKLAFPAKPKLIQARTWAELRTLEELLPLPDGAEPIRWEDVPQGLFETDPDKLEYSRRLQSLHSPPEHVDDTPIGEHIQKTLAELAQFAIATAPPDRQLLPIIPAVVRERPKAKPYLPKGNMSSRQTRSGERQLPILPHYSWRTALTLLRRSDLPGFSASDISLATGASSNEVEAIASAYKQLGAPTDVVTAGEMLKYYDGPLLDAIIAELIGLNVAQMALRLNVAEASITAFIRKQSLPSTPDGRYGAHTWQLVQQAFKGAAK